MPGRSLPSTVRPASPSPRPQQPHPLRVLLLCPHHGDLHAYYGRAPRTHPHCLFRRLYMDRFGNRSRSSLSRGSDARIRPAILTASGMRTKTGSANSPRSVQHNHAAKFSHSRQAQGPQSKWTLHSWCPFLPRCCHKHCASIQTSLEPRPPEPPFAPNPSRRSLIPSASLLCEQFRGRSSTAPPSHHPPGPLGPLQSARDGAIQEKAHERRGLRNGNFSRGPINEEL
ncbi:hypothetical protein FB451DRAFT_1565010, partial [Mycena latifolia]